MIFGILNATINLCKLLFVHVFSIQFRYVSLAMCVFAESLNCDGVKKRTKYSLAQAWNMGMGKWARQPSSSWIRRNKTKIVIKLNGLFVVDVSSWSHGVCSYMHLMVLAYVNGPCGSIGRSFVKRPHRWLQQTVFLFFGINVELIYGKWWFDSQIVCLSEQKNTILCCGILQHILCEMNLAHSLNKIAKR